MDPRRHLRTPRSTMRIAVGLLACLGTAALTSALADPSIEAQPAATTAQAAPSAATAPAPGPASDAAAAQTAAKAAAAKVELDKDTQHFIAEGYRPEMRRGEQVYCKKETVLGSRLAPVKYCGTIEELRIAEQRAKAGVSDAQRQNTNPMQ